MRPNTLRGAAAPRIVGVAMLSAAASLAHADDIKTTVTRTAKTDGSASVSVAGVPAWLEGAQFGIDLSLAAAPVQTVQPNRVLPWGVSDSSSAAAWAKVSLPTEARWLPWNQTTLDMRVDPTQDAGRVGTTFSRSWSLSDHLTASLNDSYAITHSLDQAGGWETGKSVSVNLKDTGTTLSVATTTSSSERAWLPSASAQQTLIGPLNLTTTVASTGSEINKSITAGFKHNW